MPGPIGRDRERDALCAKEAGQARGEGGRALRPARSPRPPAHRPRSGKPDDGFRRSRVDVPHVAACTACSWLGECNPGHRTPGTSGRLLPCACAPVQQLEPAAESRLAIPASRPRGSGSSCRRAPCAAGFCLWAPCWRAWVGTAAVPTRLARQPLHPTTSARAPNATVQTINARRGASPPLLAGFSVNIPAGNAITITGDGALSYTSTNASPLTTTPAAPRLMSVPAAILPARPAALPSTPMCSSGRDYGISAHNNWKGALTRQWQCQQQPRRRHLRDQQRHGRAEHHRQRRCQRRRTNARNYGTNLQRDHRGRHHGQGWLIRLRHRGDQLRWYGRGHHHRQWQYATSGTGGTGIYAGNSSAGTNLSVTTAAANTASMRATTARCVHCHRQRQVATGGTGGAGIQARSNHGTDLSVTTAAVSGGNYGISAFNYGHGALTIHRRTAMSAAAAVGHPSQAPTGGSA